MREHKHRSAMKYRYLPIATAAETLGHALLADELEVSRAAIYNAIEAQREIYVVFRPGSGYTAFEIKLFGETTPDWELTFNIKEEKQG